MANKTIAITSELYSGTVGMKLFLLHPTTGAIGNNASGDVLTEGSNGLFTTVVDEAITGWYRVLVTDSVDSPLIEGGWVLITSDTVATYVVDNPQSSVGAVWDEPLTGATHNNPTSAGRRLRTLADTVILKEGDTVAADNAGSINGTNNLGRIRLQPDVGTVCVGQAVRVAGQVRFIEAYEAGTQYATVDSSWCTIPSPGDEYSIFNLRTSLIQRISSAVVGTIAYPIAKLWEMLEDSSGWRFTAKALEESPGSSVIVYPLSGSSPTPVEGTTITTFLGSSATIGPIAIYGTGSNPDLNLLTLEIVISRKWRGDILVIPNANIIKDPVNTNQFSFSVAGATSIPGEHTWAIKKVSDNDPLMYGDFIVKQVANKDSLS